MAVILVADDDENFSKLLEELLRKAGHWVQRAVDGQIGPLLDGRTLDLAILDMQMPGGGAPAAALRLRAHPATAKIPIMIVSAMPVEKQREWFKDTAGMMFLRKPASIDDIHAAIAALLPKTGS